MKRIDVAAGDTRCVLLVGKVAIKFPRLATAKGRARGRACNRWERETWGFWAPRFEGWRDVLAPVLWADRWGWVVVMARTSPVEEDGPLRAAWAVASDLYPTPSCESKVQDWGRLAEGRIVAHDYAQAALSEDGERERRAYLARFRR